MGDGAGENDRMMTAARRAKAKYIVKKENTFKKKALTLILTGFTFAGQERRYSAMAKKAAAKKSTAKKSTAKKTTKKK